MRFGSTTCAIVSRGLAQVVTLSATALSGITLDELMALGHRPGDTPDERFNMAVMGLRLAGRSNAVAKLHGEVSREMFSDLWPDVPVEETPIQSVTNGVHAHTWTAPEMADLFTRYDESEETKRLNELFPLLIDAPLLETRVCQYETTPDTHFLIDRHPQLHRPGPGAAGGRVPAGVDHDPTGRSDRQTGVAGQLRERDPVHP